MNWIEILMSEFNAKEIIQDIKKQFKNKEIHYLLDCYIIPALKDKKMVLERANLKSFTIKSKVDSSTISVKIDTFIYKITNIEIYLYLIDDRENTELTVNYMVIVNEEEGKITIKDSESEITKNDSQRIIKSELDTKIQTYIDNNLRYELKNISLTDFLNSSLSNQHTREIYIDLEKRAVSREVIYAMDLGASEQLSIKYLETDHFLSNPFNDLYQINYAEHSNNMNDSTVESFNDFVYGGNNISLTL